MRLAFTKYVSISKKCITDNHMDESSDGWVHGHGDAKLMKSR